jgi:RNA polymerase sigma-70 factor (ECF subfamily)
LLELTGSPVVAVNRAVTLGQTAGPTDALAALDELARDPRLAGYQPYWAARADLLARLGRPAMADAAYARAIALEPDAAVRCFLEQRRVRIRPNFA